MVSKQARFPRESGLLCLMAIIHSPKKCKINHWICRSEQVHFVSEESPIPNEEFLRVTNGTHTEGTHSERKTLSE